MKRRLVSTGITLLVLLPFDDDVSMAQAQGVFLGGIATIGLSMLMLGVNW